MKKVAIIAFILAGLMLLGSCGKSADKEETKSSEEETTIAENDAPAVLTVDFATVKVSDFVYAYEGGENVTLADGAKAFKSSKPSVATVDEDGQIIPHSKGVTLVAYENGEAVKAIAVCVFARGEQPDRASGGAAEVVEIGQTYMHTSPIGGAEYTSSDDSVVDVSGAPNLYFAGSGYAYVTCASASRPFTYSFIVYDRTVE